MSEWDWITLASAMGIACLAVCRWWVRACDTREPRYTSVWRNIK